MAALESVGRNNPRFMEYLEKIRDRHLEILVKSLDGDSMRRAQGATQALSALIDELNQWKNPRK